MTNEAKKEALSKKIYDLVMSQWGKNKEESDAIWQEVYKLQKEMRALSRPAGRNEEAYVNVVTEGYGW